jgi:hypothetical protein
MMLLSHLVKPAIHALSALPSRVVPFGAIGAGVSLLFAYQTTHVWPPMVITVIVAGIVGGVLTAERDFTGGIEPDVEAPAHHR